MLEPTLQTISNNKLFFAGQITGVEGYVESTSSGLIAGLNMGRILNGMEPIIFPISTAHGSLCAYITDRTIKNFQPMNINFGIFEQIKGKHKSKKEKNMTYSNKALQDIEKLIKIL